MTLTTHARENLRNIIWVASRGPRGSVSVSGLARQVLTVNENGDSQHICIATNKTEDEDEGEEPLVDRVDGVEVRFVPVGRTRWEHYNQGFANTLLWAHLMAPYMPFEMPSKPNRRTWWDGYNGVSEMMAEETMRVAVREHNAGRNPVVLAHDYHMFRLARFMKEEAEDGGGEAYVPPVGLFIHTPWSAADKFVKCPFAKKIVEGMLQFDLIAFHAQVFEKNFRATVDALGFRTEEARIKTVPAALDPKYFHALRPQPPAKFDSLPADGMRIVAVERIEPVKGADKCLAAFKVLLTRRSDLMGHLQLVLVGYDDEDSRLQVSAYREYFRKIKGLIDEINERFGQPGYLPVKTVGHLSQQELMGIYHHPTTRVVIVSSTADGMNFIHQEAALMGDAPPWYMPLLSEHAGAAAMIGGHGKARLFNPLLLDDHVNAMLAGLEVPREEAHACMRAIRANMEEYTSRHWADGLIEVTCRNAQELRGYAHSDVDQDES